MPGEAGFFFNYYNFAVGLPALKVPGRGNSNDSAADDCEVIEHAFREPYDRESPSPARA